MANYMRTNSYQKANKLMQNDFSHCASIEYSHVEYSNKIFRMYKTVHILVMLIFLFWVFPVMAKEDCSLEGIGLDEETNIAEKLYYTGTCHYRNKDYNKAAKKWQMLGHMKNISAEFEGLQVDVLNNLGFLMFYGYGIEKNQFEAIDYWKKAVLEGHTESEYHLCHAYADIKEPTYNKQKAKKHCSKALLIYKGMDVKDEEILTVLKTYNSKLN